MNNRTDIYVHHHGMGHLHRARAIAEHLEMKPVIYTSRKSANHDGSGSFERTIILPKDPDPPELSPAIRYDDLPCFHHAPVPCPEMATRAAVLTKSLAADSPKILLVDVSVEVALQARLCGLPVAVMRQHGIRNDLAHQLAYRSAEFLLAPFPEVMEDEKTPQVVRDQTVYSSGFCRYGDVSQKSIRRSGNTKIVVITGGGGEMLSEATLDRILSAFTGCEIHLVGKMPPRTGSPDVIAHNWVENPAEILQSADLIVSSAGHNAVMEAGFFRKPMILIPEQRPFCEQYRKAVVMERLGLVARVSGWDVGPAEWTAAASKAADLDTGAWAGIYDGSGARPLAGALDSFTPPAV